MMHHIRNCLWTRPALNFRYMPDDAGFGSLIAAVKSGAFAGEGTAWANPDQMEATFISALNDFPLDRNLPIIEGGLMRVDLATEFWANAERKTAELIGLRKEAQS